MAKTKFIFNLPNNMLHIKLTTILVFIISSVLTSSDPPKNIDSYKPSISEQHLWIRICQKQMLDYIDMYNEIFGRKLYIDVYYQIPFACRFSYWTNQQVKIGVYMQLCDLEWITPIDTWSDCGTVYKPPKNMCNMTGETYLDTYIDDVFSSKLITVDTGKCPVPRPSSCDITSHIVTNITSGYYKDSVIRTNVDFYCNNKVLKYSQQIVTCKKNGIVLPSGTEYC